MDYFSSIFRALRVQNLIILAVAQLVTAYFLGNPSLTIFTNFSLWGLIISTSFIAAGGYIINDYYDIKIDLVNHPETVVIGSSLSRRQAIIMHGMLNFTGIALGASISLILGAINLLAASLLWWYSNYLKQIALVGNLAISVLSFASIFMVSILFPERMTEIAIFGFFAGAISAIREIIKDIEDQVGDKKFGCRTLPVVIGVRKTKLVLAVLIVAFSSSYLILSYAYFQQWVYFLVILIPFLLILLKKLMDADTKRDFRRLSGFCKLIMLVGIGLMVLV